MLFLLGKMLARIISGLHPVLAHGDLWSDNIMWKKSDGGDDSVEIYALYDWQVVHYGKAIFDKMLLDPAQTGGSSQAAVSSLFLPYWT